MVDVLWDRVVQQERVGFKDVGGVESAEVRLKMSEVAKVCHNKG